LADTLVVAYITAGVDTYAGDEGQNEATVDGRKRGSLKMQAEAKVNIGYHQIAALIEKIQLQFVRLCFSKTEFGC
jgi:hypothetical protein